MILGMGIPELLLIVVVVLVIFGPKNLPKLGKSLGKTVKNIREGMDGDEGEQKATDVTDTVEDVTEDAQVEEPAAEVAEDVVFCNKCGAKNPKGSEFCNKCGAKLASE